MHYYIDGYNMLFHLLRAEDELQVQRQQIIEELHLKASNLQISLSIVFDAPNQIGDFERSNYREMDIYFTAQGITADEFLLQLIRRSLEPEMCVVVTNDKNLSRAIRYNGGKTENIGQFLTWLNKRYKNRLSKRKKEKVVIPSIERKIQEGSDDYYLSAFERQVEDVSPVKAKAKKQNLPKPKPEPKEDDWSRWLKAFSEPEKKERDNLL